MREELEQLLDNLDGLSWIPWIGENFLAESLEQRILFVGESHYLNKPEDLQQYSDKEMTRNIVKGMAIDGNGYGSPFFENIHKMIFSRSNLTADQKAAFWKNIGFYNFIQTPMSSKKGRPGKADFEEGWRVFYQLLTILKPTACIFLGITAGNYYRHGSKHKGQFVLKDYHWGDAYFGRARSIYLQLEKPIEQPIELYFVKHPSNYFSPEKCRNFLKSRNKGMMQFLKNSVQTGK